MIFSVLGSCSYHDGFLYDISTPELERCTPSEAMKKLEKLERDVCQNSTFIYHHIRTTED